LSAIGLSFASRIVFQGEMDESVRTRKHSNRVEENKNPRRARRGSQESLPTTRASAVQRGISRGYSHERLSMFTTDHSLLEGMSLPEDLRQWLPERSLVHLALEAVQTVSERLPRAGSNFQPFRPPMMLTLLSYCYAVGLSGSTDIERMAETDSTVRYICAGARPDWLTIQRFRRQNVELLRECLACLLHKAWLLKTGGELIMGGIGSTLAKEIDRAVQDRIDTAIILDAAANDV
jgi:hypothetical protein